jgi:hypothetical protein
MSFKNSGYTILDNTRSIVVQLDSKLSESWNNNFIGGYDKQIEDRGLQGGGLFLPLILKTDNPMRFLLQVYNRKLKFYFSRSRSFYSRNKLSYSTLHFTDNVTKQ